MLLEKFYTNISDFVCRLEPFYQWFPDIQNFAIQVRDAILILQHHSTPQPSDWSLAHYVIPTLVECKTAFREKNVVGVLQNCVLAQRCQLLRIWSCLKAEDRNAAFSSLALIGTFADFLSIIPGKYEAADRVSKLLDGKLRHAGYDVGILFTNPAQLGTQLLEMINELTVDKSFEYEVMTTLEKEITWPVVRQCLTIFDLPEAVFSLFDNLIGGLSEENKDSQQPPTKEKIADGPKPTTLSFEALLPKNIEDFSTMMGTFAPLLSDAKTRAEIDGKKFMAADAIAMHTSQELRALDPTLMSNKPTNYHTYHHPAAPTPPPAPLHFNPGQQQQPPYPHPSQQHPQQQHFSHSPQQQHASQIHAHYNTQIQQMKQQMEAMQQQLAQMSAVRQPPPLSSPLFASAPAQPPPFLFAPPPTAAPYVPPPRKPNRSPSFPGLGDLDLSTIMAQLGGLGGLGGLEAAFGERKEDKPKKKKKIPLSESAKEIKLKSKKKKQEKKPEESKTEEEKEQKPDAPVQ